MGEIADWMLAGGCCQTCGVVMDDLDEPGFPRYCDACDPDARPAPRRQGRQRRKKEKPR